MHADLHSFLEQIRKHTRRQGRRREEIKKERRGTSRIVGNKCCLGSRLVSFRFIPFRFVDRLVEALEEPPSRASITATGWKQTGSGDGRNKKMKILELARFFFAARSMHEYLYESTGTKLIRGKRSRDQRRRRRWWRRRSQGWLWRNYDGNKKQT